MGYGTALIDSGEIELYRFGRSQQVFRGPRPSLKSPYIAFIGGSEPFGKFVASPFPKLVQKKIKTSCANWGTPGAGPGFFLKDPVILEACSNAEICVVQAMNAEPLSNRMYSVFPRRNQRIRGVSDALKSLYPKTDFSRFKYVSAMLKHLRQEDARAFQIVHSEMTAAWMARMLELLADIETTKILLWLDVKGVPSVITEDLVDSLAPHVDQVLKIQIDEEMQGGILGGASRESFWMTRPVHELVANRLTPSIKSLMTGKSDLVA